MSLADPGQQGLRVRIFAFLEIVSIVGLIELYLWILKGTDLKLMKNSTVVAIVGLISYSIWIKRSELFAATRKPVVQTWAKVLAISLMLAAVLLMGARELGIMDKAVYSSFWEKLLSNRAWWQRKFGTVLLQQVALQLCLLPACMNLLRNRWAGIGLAAALFSLIHSPNPYLMLLTFCAGLFWCWLWLDSRRLVPLICSHLLLAILAREYCNHALYNMRVGVAVLELFPHAVQTASGDTFLNDPMQMKGEWVCVAIEGEEAVCRGWAADIRRGETIDELLVLSNTDRLARRYPMQARPSEFVRTVYGPEIEMSEFELRLPLELFRKKVRIYAYREGIGYSEVTYRWEDQKRAANPFLVQRKLHKGQRLANSKSKDVL